jgi:hypothetical protein
MPRQETMPNRCSMGSTRHATAGRWSAQRTLQNVPVDCAVNMLKPSLLGSRSCRIGVRWAQPVMPRQEKMPNRCSMSSTHYCLARKHAEWTDKPGSVGDGHFSRPRIAPGLERHTRPVEHLGPRRGGRSRRGGVRALVCLVLLPVGFTLPIWSPRLRCALTAPFHPYLDDESPRRYFFCGTVPVLADGGRYPPPCPVEPGLSSPWTESTQPTQRPSGPLRTPCDDSRQDHGWPAEIIPHDQPRSNHIATALPCC